MAEYKLQLYQLVDYPRCRIYRQFIHSLLSNARLRIGLSAGLFHYTVLCCFANFRTSYKHIQQLNFTIRPGEWICTVDELKEWFRLRRKYQVFHLLDELQTHHLIAYDILGRGELIKYRIKGWHRFNRVLDYNAPCQKESGFFFLPVDTASEIISYGKCSELDALLDLWINGIYNDPSVQGSDRAPVVYFRNGTGSPLLSYADLAERWGISKSTVGRYLQKFQNLGLIALYTFPGTHGSAIYLQNYLSTMFEISDVLLDKEEVAMALDINLSVSEDAVDCAKDSVSNEAGSVSKPILAAMVEKIKKLLAAQGISCASCPYSKYKLLPLSYECREGNLPDGWVTAGPIMRGILLVSCNDRMDLLRFSVSLWKEETL